MHWLHCTWVREISRRIESWQTQRELCWWRFPYKIIDDMYPCSLFMVGSFQMFQNLKKVLCFGLGTAFQCKNNSWSNVRSAIFTSLMLATRSLGHYLKVEGPLCSENPWLVNTPVGRSHLVAMLHFLRIFLVRQIVFCFVLAWSFSWALLVLGSLLLASLNSACQFCLRDCSNHKNRFIN